MPKDIKQDPAFQRLIELLSDPFTSEMTQEDMAKELGVSRGTVGYWRKQVDWDAIKTERRKKYSSKIVEVDDAMFREAKNGDVNAAKVLYERFDNWVPASQVINLHDLNEADVDAELEALIKLKRDAHDAIANTVDAVIRDSAAGTGQAPALPKSE